jgi:hypothetical protein
MSGESRELTREERLAIRKLVTEMCANFQREYGCLPLEGACYMFLKAYTGAYCKYFREAVLPLDPTLEAALMGGAVDMRPCAICGQLFPTHHRRAYCSVVCEKNALRKQKRAYMRKKRTGCGN